jgi:hypothetical protein
MNKKTTKITFFLLLIAALTGSIMLVSAESNGPGTELVYSTYVGTTSWEGAEAITVDNQGRAYVVAITEATGGFPGATSSESAHEVNTALFRLNPEGTAVEYVLYFNPDPDVTELEDYGYGIAVDNSGSAYIVGHGGKDNLCTFMGAVPGYDQTFNGGDYDAFVMKIKSDGSGLEYCTFIGGSEWDGAYDIALDQDNNAYVTGFTWSPNFPTTTGAYDETINGSRDIFVAQVSDDGTRLEYSTFMGGTGQESARAIALDNQNNAYVTGWTTSNDLPTPAPVFDDTLDGFFDSFVFKLNNDGSDLIFNSYLGGTDEERGYDIILDGQGNIFLTGETLSLDYPVTSGAMDTTFGGGDCSFQNCPDGYVARLNPTATILDFATYIGGDNRDITYGLSLHQDGGVFVVGESISENDFPTTPTSYDPTPNGEGDAFMLWIDSTGSTLNYGTYLGSTDIDVGTAFWTDGQNNIYLTGLTFSSDFPTTPGAYDTTINGDFDVFVSKLMLPVEVEELQSFIPAVFK